MLSMRSLFVIPIILCIATNITSSNINAGSGGSTLRTSGIRGNSHNIKKITVEPSPKPSTLSPNPTTSESPSGPSSSHGGIVPPPELTLPPSTDTSQDDSAKGGFHRDIIFINLQTLERAHDETVVAVMPAPSAADSSRAPQSVSLESCTPRNTLHADQLFTCYFSRQFKNMIIKNIQNEQLINQMADQCLKFALKTNILSASWNGGFILNTPCIEAIITHLRNIYCNEPSIYNNLPNTDTNEWLEQESQPGSFCWILSKYYTITKVQYTGTIDDRSAVSLSKLVKLFTNTIKEVNFRKSYFSNCLFPRDFFIGMENLQIIDFFGCSGSTAFQRGTFCAPLPHLKKLGLWCQNEVALDPEEFEFLPPSCITTITCNRDHVNDFIEQLAKKSPNSKLALGRENISENPSMSVIIVTKM